MDATQSAMLQTLWSNYQRYGFRIGVTPPLSKYEANQCQHITLDPSQLPQGFFFAQILGNTGLAYTWVERVETVAGTWANGTQAGTLNAFYAQPASAVSTVVAAGTVVVMRQSPTVPGTFEFLLASGSSLTVQTVGGTPSYPGITTEEFSTDFTVTNPVAGTARIAGNYTQTVSYLDNVCLRVTKDDDGFVKDVRLTKQRRTVTMPPGATVTGAVCELASDDCCPISSLCCPDVTIPPILYLTIMEGMDFVGTFPLTYQPTAVGYFSGVWTTYQISVGTCGLLIGFFFCESIGGVPTWWQFKPQMAQFPTPPLNSDCMWDPATYVEGTSGGVGTCDPFTWTFTKTMAENSPGPPGPSGACGCIGTVYTFVITE